MISPFVRNLQFTVTAAATASFLGAQRGVAAPLPLAIRFGDDHRVILEVHGNVQAAVIEKTAALGPDAVWTLLDRPVVADGQGVSTTDLPAERATYYRLRSLTPGPGPGAPIVAPDRTWTWVPFADAYCMEGATTGLGVNLSATSDRVLVYLDGGGACWDDATCYTLNTAVHGPFAEEQFAARVPALNQAWIFDRTAAGNPFRDYSLVYVPYCTGDAHAGDHVDLTPDHVTQHVGRRNFAAYLARLVPTFPHAQRVILAGSSVGGMGAAFNWWPAQQAFGAVRVDLIDDSGPILGAAVTATGKGLLGPDSRASWNLAGAVPPGCADCGTSLDAVLAFQSAAYPDSRAALLCHDQDQVLANYYQVTAAQFTTGLDALLTTQFDPHPHLRYFLAGGAGHTFLGTAPTATAGGTTLAAFLNAMLADDPAWNSARP